MGFEIPESIRGFVSEVSQQRAAEAVEKTLYEGAVALDLGKFEHFKPESFWSAERSRSDGRKAHAWFFLREWNSAAEHLDYSTRLNLVKKLMEVHPSWEIGRASCRERV